MNKKILLIGGGGHCKSVLDCLIKTNQFKEIGIIDKYENIGSLVLGIPVIGCDEDLPKLFHSGYDLAFVTLGSIGEVSNRIKLINLIDTIGFEIPNIIASSAVISENAILQRGIFIGKNAVVNAGAFIGNGSIINTSSTIEHDCVIGEYSHISPGSVLCGEVQIGAYTHVGANSVIKQGVKIGEHTIIGMGSVVLQDINSSMLAYGNPCREVKHI